MPSHNLCLDLSASCRENASHDIANASTPPRVQHVVSNSRNGRMDGHLAHPMAPNPEHLRQNQRVLAEIMQLRNRMIQSEVGAIEAAEAQAPSNPDEVRSEAIPIAQALPFAFGQRADYAHSMDPSVHSASSPASSRPEQRTIEYRFSLRKLAKFLCIGLVASPFLLAAVGVGSALILTRKVASIPISWPLLAARLLGLDFNNTNLKHNRLLNVLLGPATIDALTSPSKSKAAGMLVAEMFAVGMTAATFGVGGSAIIIASAITGLSYLNYLIPALIDYEAKSYWKSFMNYHLHSVAGPHQGSNIEPDTGLQAV